MRHLSDVELLGELEPTVAANLERHLSLAEEWLPHEWLPWSRGRDFTGQAGLAWAPDQSALPEAVRAAFEVNLLTEDNLPSYHHALASTFGRDRAWGTWVHRWTAEEARHAMSLRDYLLLTRAVDPVALERDRMTTLQRGWVSNRTEMLRSLAYVTFQELATRVAHRNTGRLANDPVADALLTRIAADENLHMVFYRDLMAAALAIAPEQAMEAIAAELRRFEMPGTGIPGFLRKSLLIADAGIYDARVHRDEVVAPLVKYWRLADLRMTGDAARRAQEMLAQHLDELERIAARADERQARLQTNPRF
jgi:acyl-[acyl-carrier-protein] desaturase